MHNKTIPLYNELYRYIHKLQYVKDMKIHVHPYPGSKPTEVYHYMMSHKPSLGYPSFWYGMIEDIGTYRVWIHNNAGVLIQPI